MTVITAGGPGPRLKGSEQSTIWNPTWLVMKALLQHSGEKRVFPVSDKDRVDIHKEANKP